MLIPKPFIDKVVSASTEFVPVIGPAYKYTRKAMEVTKLADPIKASTRAVGYLVSACTGPVVKYPALCSLWVTLGVAGLATGSPVLIAASLEMAEIILEE